MHSQAINGNMSQKATSINAVLSKAVVKYQAAAPIMLKLVFISLRYLGKQGIAITEHNHCDGNL